MNVKHTPGPWVQMRNWPLFIVPVGQKDFPRGGSIHPADDRRYAQPLAEVRFDFYADPALSPHRRVNKDEALACARLIAAAPDLLAALEFTVSEADKASRWLDSPARENLRSIVDNARAALAKAKGE